MQNTTIRNLSSLAAITAAIFLLAGCSSTPDAAKVDEGTTTPTAGSSAGATGSTSGLGTGSVGSGSNIASAGTVGSATSAGGLDPALTDPRNPLSKRSIFYDLDSYVVKDEYRAIVEAHAAYLKRNPGMRLIVEGNTDERGSREYNLALGQRRSEGVKRVFALLGVSDSQVQTVSFGEEKPRNATATESAYSENRRSDIRYVGE
jgi:peptidoglycan-associated lipoprotein